MRFVLSSLEAFNFVLLGPMALIDWIHKPSIVDQWEVFISTACLSILVRFGVYGDNGKEGRKEGEHRSLWVVQFVALVAH